MSDFENDFKTDVGIVEFVQILYKRKYWILLVTILIPLFVFIYLKKNQTIRYNSLSSFKLKSLSPIYWDKIISIQNGIAIFNNNNKRNLAASITTEPPFRPDQTDIEYSQIKITLSSVNKSIEQKKAEDIIETEVLLAIEEALDTFNVKTYLASLKTQKYKLKEANNTLNYILNQLKTAPNTNILPYILDLHDKDSKFNYDLQDKINNLMTLNEEKLRGHKNIINTIANYISTTEESIKTKNYLYSFISEHIGLKDADILDDNFLHSLLKKNSKHSKENLFFEKNLFLDHLNINKIDFVNLNNEFNIHKKAILKKVVLSAIAAFFFACILITLVEVSLLSIRQNFK